ncbi:unnamed protein product [Caenorhabditis brenneri]
MVIVWGEVNFWSGDPPKFASSWDECIQKCLELADCYLIDDNLNSECRIFNYGSAPMVLKKDKAYGTKVGFKRVLSSCPADGSLAPLFAEDNLKDGFTETYKSGPLAYQITIYSGIPNDIAPYRWAFDDRYFIQCPSDSLVSFRDTNKVCISIRQFSDPPSQNRTFGADLCSGNGAMGLTGPYSEDEMTTISDYFIPQLKEEIDTTKFGYFGIWTDGTRTKVEDFQLTDNTLDTVTYNALLRKDSKFEYDDGLCCFLVFVKDQNTEFWVFLCEDEAYSRAAMCRMEPLIQR